MYKNKYSGKFIIFEGLDGSGQSTQSKKLYDFFRKKGRLTILTKEPVYDNISGKKIRQVLRKNEQITPGKLQMLFVQNRKEHLNELIIPSLKKNIIVISDRYFLSTCAFGGINLNLEWLIKLNNNFLLPNIIFYLDVPVKVCLERIKKRGEDFEFFEEKKKLTKVRQNYRRLIKRFPNAYLINGELSKKEVFENLLIKLNKNIYE